MELTQVFFSKVGSNTFAHGSNSGGVPVVPGEGEGDNSMILPACLMILLVLLLIFIIRSKIWLLT